MKYEEAYEKPLRSIGLDLLSSCVLFIVLSFFTFFLGIILFLFDLIGESFALAGSLFFLMFVMLMMIVIFTIHLKMVNFIKNKDSRIFRLFTKTKNIYKRIGTENIIKYILLKLSSLSIILVIFFFISTAAVLVIYLTDNSFFMISLSYPLIMLSILLPAVAWIFFAYAFDTYGPEPRALIIIGILWGMFSTFPSLFLNTYNSTWMPQLGMETTLYSAPFFEELFKITGFILIFKEIRNETDGVLYGATFGAGFGILENFLYSANLIAGSDTNPAIGFFLLLIFRSFFNILLHMSGPVLVGFLIGHLRAKRSSSSYSMNSKYLFNLVILVFVGITLSIFNHALWNYLVGSESWLIIMIIFQGAMVFFFYIGIVLLGFLLSSMRYRKKLMKST